MLTSQLLTNKTVTT